MNRNLFILIFGITVVLTACRPVQRLTAAPGRASLELGMVGTAPNALLENGFSVFGIPKISRPIRLRATLRPFKKRDHRAYRRLRDQRDLSFSIPFVDSIADGADYVTLEIVDRAALIDALNNETNSSLRNMIMKDRGSLILTGVDLVLSRQNVAELRAARGIFLEGGADGIPSLLLKGDGDETVIPLSQTLTLSHFTMGFCWGLDPYGRPAIRSLKGPNESCGGGLEGRASELGRTENYLKF